MNNTRDVNQIEVDQSIELYNRAIEELPPIKKQRKKQKWLPMFATFMAGAIMVGTLSFVADYYSLFTKQAKPNASASAISSNIIHASTNSASSSTTAHTVSTTYEVASKAVVKIEQYSEPRASSRINDPRLWMFFGEQQQLSPQDEQSNDEEEQSDFRAKLSELQLTGSGTGYIFDEAGYILTNEHVIHNAQLVAVTVPGYDEPFHASVIAANLDLDIAVLKIEQKESKPFAIVPLGNSDDVNVGEWVMAIGNPYGYDYTLTLGIISAKDRPITVESSEGGTQTIEHMLQTDASINPGNSGGPLLNESGEVIGMNTAVNAEAQGMGFALEINEIKNYLNTLTL